MKKLSEKEIARLLSQRGTPEPPAGLGRRIKAEIPEPLEVGGGALEAAARDRVRLGALRPLWMIAASLLVVVGAGFMAVHLLAPPTDIAREIALGGVTAITDVVVTVPERSTVEKQKLAMADNRLSKTAPAPAPPVPVLAGKAEAPRTEHERNAETDGIVPFVSADARSRDKAGRIESRGANGSLEPALAAAGVLDVAVSDGREPLPGATITARRTDAPGFEPRTAVSGSDGRAELGPLPAGKYRVTSHLHGFRTSEDTVHVAEGGGSELDVVMRQAPLAEEVTVTGTLIAQPGAPGRTRPTAGSDQEAPSTAGRRAQGSTASATVTAGGDGVKRVVPAAAALHHTVTVVVRSATGAPLAGIPVSLVLLDRKDAKPLEAITGVDGAVAFAEVPEGRYRAIGRPAKGSPVVVQPIVVTVGTSQTVELRLPPPLP